MTTSSTRWVWAAAGVGLLAVGLAGGYYTGRMGSSRPAMRDSAPATPERTVLYWYDPMVPDQHFDKPGKSPFMDMPLVPRYADEAGRAGGVLIDAHQQQSVGIRAAPVELGILVTSVRVPGTLSWDLRKESVVSARVEGVLSRVQIKAPYTSVQRGQPLAAILAPQWSSAVAEAQALHEAQSSVARELRDAAQQRLRVLDVPSGVGHDGSVALISSQAGVVTEVLAREGQVVLPGTPLFRINGLDTLWLEASIPQASASELRPGTLIEAYVSALPGQTFTGRVETLLPQVEAASRTRRARIVLNNPRGELVPGMFAEVHLTAQADVARPLVPSDALISTGQANRVIVQDANGRFHPVPVTVGRSSRGMTEILSGLRGGEQVVVSGQFLIDSEASLSGALQRLGTAPAPPLPASSEHAGHAAGPAPTVSSEPDVHSGHTGARP